MGVFTASFIPVYSAIATMSSNQGYGRGIGRFWTAASLGFASASLIGGVLYETIGVNSLFILGATYGYIGILVLRGSKENFTVTKGLTLSHGYWKLLRDRDIAILCTLSIAILVASSAFNSFFTLYLVDFLNSSRFVAGLAATGTTVLGAIAYRFIGPLNDKFGRKIIFLLGTIGYAIYFATLYFVSNPSIVTILWILPIYPFIQSSSAALVSDYTSVSDRGKGLGVLEASLSLGGGIGPVIGGAIADASRFQSIIIFSLATSFATALACKILLKDSQQEKTEQVLLEVPQPV
jgi:MFS family permease